MKTCAALIVVLALPVFVAAERRLVAAHANEPLSIEHTLSDNTVEAATFAPDGKTAAIVTCHRTEPDRPHTGFKPSGFFSSRGGCRLSVVALPSGKPVPLPIGDGTSLSPAYSPDSKQLAYFSDRDGVARVWTIDLQGRTARRISAIPVRFTHHLTDPALQWSPSGSALLVRFIRQDQSLAEAMAAYDRVVYAAGPRVTTLVYRAGDTLKSAPPAARGDIDATTRMLPYDSDFALVDVATGQVRYLTRNTHVRWIGFSPDGRYVAYQDWKGSVPGAGQSYYFDASIMELATSRIVRTVRHVTSYHYLAFSSWSPTGRLFTFADCRFLTPSGEEITLKDQIEAPRCGALWDQKRDVVHAFAPESRGTMSARATLWTIDPFGRTARQVATLQGDDVQLLAPRTLNRTWGPAATNSVIAVSLEPATRHVTFSQLDLGSGEARTLWKANKWVGDAGERAVRDISIDDKLLFSAEDASHPTDLWLADASFTKPTRVTNANQQLERYNFGGSRLIEWRSADDGRKLRGALFLPADYKEGQRYPVIVRVYPEPQSRYLNSYGGDTRLDNGHLWTTRGYAVFLPDGYFAPARPISGMVASTLPGIDKLVELGVADPDRIGIYGHSYGGYSTLALLTQTSRFKAAVATSGPYDLWTQYAQMDIGGTSDALSTLEERLGGSPWEFRERYIENSPTFYLDRITTPLLLFHGQIDTVPVLLADMVFVGMRRLGKTIEYVKYLDEGHTFRNPPNEVDYLRRVIAWFEKYLAPNTAGS